MSEQSDEQRFTAIFDAFRAPVLAYARRRVGDDSAQDIVADTFLVAWRNLDDVPAFALPWLYRAAAFQVSNWRRSLARSEERAPVRLAPEPVGPDPSEEVVELDSWATAFRRLSESDREVLRLIAWESLSAADAAFVLGCSLPTFKVRVHRARRRLLRLLELEDAPESQSTSDARRLSKSSPNETPVIRAVRAGETSSLSIQGESL
ncbi:MAG TPA: RNA polymerase sigma factor [Acidimicrobiales bacterium]|nr:RNA polymerase sigma factor [Acidimicrobiales bacterium]